MMPSLSRDKMDSLEPEIPHARDPAGGVANNIGPRRLVAAEVADLDRRYVLEDPLLKTGEGLETVIAFIRERGMLD